MSLDIRTAALQLAATIHTDADKIIDAAEKFTKFLAAESKAIVATAEKEVAAVAAAVTPRKNKTPPASPAPAAAPPSASAAAPAASPTNSRDACTKAVITLVQKQAKATAIKVLAGFGVEKVPQLKEEQLDAALVALKDAIASLPAA